MNVKDFSTKFIKLGEILSELKRNRSIFILLYAILLFLEVNVIVKKSL